MNCAASSGPVGFERLAAGLWGAWRQGRLEKAGEGQMGFILRWLLILILLALVALMLAAQPLLGLIQTHAGFDLTLLKTAWAGLAASTDWIEATLWYAAAAFLTIAVIRLVRRTQAFWMWLLA